MIRSNCKFFHILGKDAVGDSVIGLLKSINAQIRDDVLKEIVSSDQSASEIESSLTFRSLMADETVLSTCVELPNGDKMQINTNCGDQFLEATITQCSEFDTPRRVSLHQRFLLCLPGAHSHVTLYFWNYYALKKFRKA